MFDRLFALLGTLGDFSSLKDKIALLGVVANAVRKLPTADTSREYHEIAIDILAGVAPLTKSPLDDGALIAARALALDAGWHAWIDAQLASTGPAVETQTSDSGLPDGVLAISMPAEVTPPAWAQPRVEAFSLGGLSTFVTTVLPILIELIRELRREKQLAPAAPLTDE